MKQEQACAELIEPFSDSPAGPLRRWFEEAKACESIQNADAMALSTVDAEGWPRVRFVLCRGLGFEAGDFFFYTNYDSAKGIELAQQAKASAAFYWDPLGRQVRLSGHAVRAPESDSDAYWQSRPVASQLAAWASEQSQPVADRAALDERYATAAARFGDGQAPPIPRPPHWGGYRLAAERIELWSSRRGRLHDRVVWTRGSAQDVHWDVQRLQP